MMLHHSSGKPFSLFIQKRQLLYTLFGFQYRDSTHGRHHVDDYKILFHFIYACQTFYVHVGKF